MQEKIVLSEKIAVQRKNCTLALTKKAYRKTTILRNLNVLIKNVILININVCKLIINKFIQIKTFKQIFLHLWHGLG